VFDRVRIFSLLSLQGVTPTSVARRPVCLEPSRTYPLFFLAPCFLTLVFSRPSKTPCFQP
jgi:hypothetical protein